jgi:MFS family permease
MTEASVTKPGFYGWTNVILLFVIFMAAVGLVFYGYSVIFPTMIKSLGWNRGAASIAHSIQAVLLGLLTPAVAFSIQKLGPKKTLLTGFIVLLAALILMGTVMNQLWQWIVLWGLVAAFGLAFGGALPLQTMILHWFNVKRSTAMGIVMTGGVAGGFIAQPFYTWLMEATHTWRSGWLFGSVFVLLGLICSLFIVNHPRDLGQHVDGLSPEDPEEVASRENGSPGIHKTLETWSVKEALKTRVVWFFVIIIAVHIMSLFFITSHGILNFLDRGFSEMQAASILSITILGSALIRFPVGALGDKVEPRYIITVAFGCMMASLFLIWKNQSLEMIIAAGFLFGAGFGTLAIMFPTLMGNYFGAEAFAGINGVIAPIFVVFAATVPVAGGFIFETTGSYDLAYLCLVILLATAFAFSFFMKPPVKKTRSN